MIGFAFASTAGVREVEKRDITADCKDLLLMRGLNYG